MKELSGNEIRRQFIDFFIEKGHTAVRSASLVPAGDATLLFTNAGMVQFKEIFLGTDSRPYTRAVDSQKCMRVAGKHNDLDDVGRDDSHHTFFEMLGNWSFGDYYKKEAISWAWELLTDVWGLDKSKLWTTCFKDEKGEVPQDEEAYNYWTQQPGFVPSHALYFGRKENFWEMADTGPCGPCSEIHIDLGPERCNKKGVPGHVCQVNGDCSRFMELWNLVFIQYNRMDKDTLVPLAHCHVDTGMGFERIVSVLQRKDSNYKTDLFASSLKVLLQLTGKTEEEMTADFTPWRVIADHARAAAFLIGDGVVPGNVGRNYICRMIIRRAVRFGQQIGLHEPFMDKVAEAVIETYGDAYPELIKMKDAIRNSIRWEEDRFKKTLNNGISHLNDVIGEMERDGKKIIEGGTCFDLYATHGLPLEITYDLVRDRGLDVDRKGFAKAAEEHRLASGGGKSIGRMGGEDAEQFSLYLAKLIADGELSKAGVACNPYDWSPVPSKVLLIIKNDESVSAVQAGDVCEVVTAATNFYLEMGGQIGDRGEIKGDRGKIAVDAVRRPAAGIYAHHGKVAVGEIKVGDAVSVEIDQDFRHDIMRNHTATHLLHSALKQTVGEQARQAGSLVGADKLRFDFNSNCALTTEQLSKIETLVNENILKGLPVWTKTEKIDDAMKEGVTALFNEKYGSEVRVVRIGEEHLISAELCGGTHVRNTSEISLFVIVSEGSVATGIRRIEAVTGSAAINWVRKNVAAMRNLVLLFNVSEDQLIERAEGIQKLANKSQKEIEELRRQLALKDFEKYTERIQIIEDAETLAVNVPNASVETLRELADRFKAENPKAVGIFASVQNGQALFVVTVADEMVKWGLHAGNISKELAAIVGGSGGGKPTMAQAGGKIPEKIQDALDQAVNIVRKEIKAKNRKD